MSRKHSTLLKEEVDEDEGSGSGSDKKKRDKEKYQDGGERRRKLKKGGSDRREGYYNNSMANNAKVQPVKGAAINPTADDVMPPVLTQLPSNVPTPLQPPPTHPGHRQQVHGRMVAVMPNQQAYNMGVAQHQIQQQQAQMTAVQWQQQQQQQQHKQLQHQQLQQQQVQQQQVQQHQEQQIQQQQLLQQQLQQQQQALPVRLMPPPGSSQHAVVVQQQAYQVQPQHPQTQYQPQAQPYQPHPSQGYYPGVQYPHGVPTQVAGGQGVVYVQHPTHPAHHVLGRTQSLPEEPVPQGWVPVAAPNSPTGQPQEQQVWNAQQQPQQSEHVEGNWAASGHVAGQPQGWNPATATITNVQSREEYWAAFTGSPTEAAPAPFEEQHRWAETLDHSSSDEDLGRSSSPELCGEEGEGLLRAPSLTSFAESTSSVEEEGDENVWLIQPEQQEYYTKQFRRLQPADDGVIKGPKARDFFLKSNLPTETLSKIWHLSDINKDNALNLEEFCIAMHLVVAMRHGLELPSTLPSILLNFNRDSTQEVGPMSPQQQNNINHRETIDTQPKEHMVLPLTSVQDAREDHHQHPGLSRPRSFSDPNNPEEPHDTSRKASVPASAIHSPSQATESSSTAAQPSPLSPTPHIGIERPRASAKISLLDSLPGQLLPPPSGKFAREGWAKSDGLCPISGESDSDSDTSDATSPPSSPIQSSPLHATPFQASPVASLPENVAIERAPTPPTSPRPSSPQPEHETEVVEIKVIHRPNKRTGERPRSAGDVNQIKPLRDDSVGSTPSTGSQGSDGKKENPPPPPPRNKKGHSRSSSLDLNKLFATKVKQAKDGRAMSTSSASSSHSSQNSETALPLRTEVPHEEDPKHPETSKTPEKTTQPVAEDEDFADFSRFDSFVRAQGSQSTTQASVTSSVGRSHRRSQSLGQCMENLPPPPRKSTMESVLTTNRPKQEALPRPVPKMKPASPPPVKLSIRRTDRSSEKDGEKERKLNTEPPKVVVKPLTKETKMQNTIRELKDKNLALSRLNSELQLELKEAMEARIALELKLERLKPFKSK